MVMGWLGEGEGEGEGRTRCARTRGADLAGAHRVRPILGVP